MSLEDHQTDTLEPVSAPNSTEISTENGANQAPPDGIRAFDQYGQEVIVPRAEWSANVLPGMLREAWDQPDNLYVLLINSLNDGFVAELTEAAAHLAASDTIPARGACTWAIVLIQLGRFDEAEKVLTEFTEKNGEDGSVLVNLAKVYAAKGDHERAASTLWHGLELEPNQENGLGWFAANAQGTGGEEAARAALEQVRAISGSWRPQMWLARAELGAGNTDGARALYSEALDRAPKPVPPDLLMQMSGDLGGSGRIAELVEFTAPHYVPEVHGLPVGNNLMKALVDLGQLDDAARVKDVLASFNRADWNGALGFWDQEITRRRLGATGTANAPQAQGDGQVQIGMLRVDGPIWLPPGSPARKIFGEKSGGPIVTFLGGSAEMPEQPTQTQLQMSDALGRMTRALPLYLAEQTEMRTAATGRAMLPWAVGSAGQPSGFVVSGQRWPDETAISAVGDPANRSDYVVTVHVDAEVEPWEASLVFVRASDGTRIGELEAEFAPGQPEEALPKLADEMVELLSALGSAPTPAQYTVPQGTAFGSYLLRLEQLLSVRCAGMEGSSPQFLAGEDEILNGELAMCEAQPESVPARLLLVETMSGLARIKPETVQGFQEQFVKLQQEKPIAALDAAFVG